MSAARKCLLLTIVVSSGVPVYADPLTYVARFGSVAVIDTATNTVVDTIDVPFSVGRRPAISADGAFVYVLGGEEFANPDAPGFVAEINTATNLVEAQVEVGGSPEAIAVTPDGNFVYVVNRTFTSVSVVDSITDTVAATIQMNPFPFSIAMAPDGAFAYVGGFFPDPNLEPGQEDFGTISVINTTTNEVEARTTVPGVFLPQDLAITPDGSRLYIGTLASTELSVMSTATNTIDETVPVGVDTAAVVISTDGDLAYVSGNESIAVLRISTGTVEAEIPGIGACDLAITPDGAFLYATDFFRGSNVVIVVDTATLEHVATVEDVGPGCGIAMAPEVTDVAIDIIPGRMPNRFNPRNNATLRVAVLGSEDFDATLVDVSTAAFGPGKAAPVRDGHVKDANHDGFIDIVFRFPIRSTGIECGDTEASLSGRTFEGEVLFGTDSIKTAGCKPE